MLNNQMILWVVSLITLGMTCTAPAADKTKEFAEYNCRLSLPEGSDFEWLDPTLVPQSVALMRNSAGTTVVLIVTKVPSDFKLNTDGFDAGLFAPGVATKLRSDNPTFLGLPCYQVFVHLEQSTAQIAIRAFSTQGFLYQLQLIGDSVPVDDQDKLASLFSMFEFINSPPTVVANDPVSMPAANAPSPDLQAYNFSQMMGRVAGICIVVMIMLAVGRKLLRKKKATP
jgi:hypothetical protein